MLDATVGSASANSYVVVADVATYLTATGQDSKYPTWDALDATQKEVRLELAARMLDTLQFRGRKACREQALQWPRVFSGDKFFGNGTYLFNEFDRRGIWDLWTDLTDFADSYSPALSYPSIPTEVQDVQIELCLQIVHTSLMSYGAGEAAGKAVKSVNIASLLDVEFVSDGSSSVPDASSYLQGRSVGALSIVQLKLAKWITRIRGEKL